MVDKAAEGYVYAARFVMDWLIKLGPSVPDDGPDIGDAADLSPAQRAVMRARILAELEERGEESPA
jgi:hypothetical protein